MLLVHEDSLPDAYALALAERARGKDFITVELETLVRPGKRIILWEGIIGEVIGRRFYDAPNDDMGEHINPDFPPSRTVRAVILRVRIPDVTEAMRRFAQRERNELAKPIRANRVAPKSTAGTAR